MAVLICACGTAGLGNTGKPGCVPIGKVRVGTWLMPRYDSTGAENYIDLTSLLDDAYFTGLLNEDPDKRIYPLMNHKNRTSEKGEPVFHEFEDLSRKFVRDNPRAITFLLADESYTMLKQLNSSRCTEMVAFEIDAEGKIYGMQRGGAVDKLYGIAIEPNSFYANMIQATDTTVEHIMVMYMYKTDEIEENIAYITSESYDADFNPLNVEGLEDALVNAATNISTTGFKVKIDSKYGDLGTPLPISGLLAADFALAEISPAPGAIVITSVTESPDGTYTFVIPAQTVADVLRLTPSKNGFEFSPATIDITIV